MRSNPLHFPARTLIMILSLFTASQPAAAQHETLIYSFTVNNNLGPQGGLAIDSSGNLYGTSNDSVYELMPQSGGGWTENTLFTAVPLQNTYGVPTFDALGNLYAVAQGVGTTNDIVFELSPSGGGTWTETTLYTFPATATHGWNPYAAPIFDSVGNLYSTTYDGGAYGTQNNGGVVYELIPQSGGGSSERVLHSFGNGTDGSLPYGGLIMDSAGNLYGTTASGGADGFGIVYEQVRQTGGAYREKILHTFTGGLDGANPHTSLIMDSARNLYGSTPSGGAHSGGVVFELMPQANGTWKDKLLHAFGSGTDGISSYGTLAFDTAGNLYGTTFFGGADGASVVFKLTPQTGGTWAYTILHNFANNDSDGQGPLAGVTIDGSGNIFGTTEAGGTIGEGTVYEITP